MDILLKFHLKTMETHKVDPLLSLPDEEGPGALSTKHCSNKDTETGPTTVDYYTTFYSNLSQNWWDLSLLNFYEKLRREM